MFAIAGHGSRWFRDTKEIKAVPMASPLFLVVPAEKVIQLTQQE